MKQQVGRVLCCFSSLVIKIEVHKEYVKGITIISDITKGQKQVESASECNTRQIRGQGIYLSFVFNKSPL